MNRFLLSCLVALLFGVGNMFALTCVTEDFTVPIPGGGCCTIKVSYCYGISGNNVSISVGTIKVPSSCGNLYVTPGLFNFLRKKILYRLSQQSLLPQNIPNCPDRATLIVTTSQSSCYAVATPIPPSSDYVWTGCGDALCQKVCEVCLSTTETDGCNNNEPMLQYLGCTYTGGACTGQAPATCSWNTCDSN